MRWVNARTTVSTVGSSIVVAVEGTVDLSSVGSLHSDLVAAVRRHAGETVFVDLDAVRGLDDAGLGVLLASAAAARDTGGDIVIVCSDGPVRRRIEHTRLDRAVEVRAALSDAPAAAPIFHLALPEDWAAAHTVGEYRMSTRGATLDEVGFIHCSTERQLEATAHRFYGDLSELVVLTVDPARVGSPIVAEPPSPESDELFPHIYGPLPVDAVVATRRWFRALDGTWSLDA